MTSKARFTQADVTRAIKGARAAGFENVRIEIDRDGTLKIIPERMRDADDKNEHDFDL